MMRHNYRHSSMAGMLGTFQLSPKNSCSLLPRPIKWFHQDGTARSAKAKGKPQMSRAETFVTFIFPGIFFVAIPSILTVFLIAERFNRYYNP
jgi:hypothetical protein